jgi:hypothetical protein
MIAARAAAVACVLAALPLAPRPADAGPALAAAVLPAADDVRSALLIGPSGEVYEPAAAATWNRRSGGGIASDVAGAALGAGDLYAVGRSTPLYRRRAGVWQALRLGQRGPVLWGTGPTPSLAVGRHVFILGRGGWTRVGQAAMAVTSLWATADRDVVLIAGGAPWRLRGSSFVRVPRPAIASAVFGTIGPWLLSAGTAIGLGRPRAVVPLSAGAVRTAMIAGDAVWFVIAPPTGPLVLERHVQPATATARRPPIQIIATPVAIDAAIAAVLVDRIGRALIVTRDGGVQVWADGAWTAGAVSDALPPSRAGAGPARTR